MDFIANLLGDKSADLIQGLVGAGFSAEQAEGFLPGALESVMGGLQKVDVQGLMDADGAAQTAGLLENMDLGALAGMVGGDSSLVSNGLQAIIPQVFGFLKDNPTAASLLSMAGDKGGLGGLANMAKGLFS